MCLSPEIDLVAGTAIGVIALETIRITHANRIKPIASIPTIFSIHSFASAVIWLASQGRVSHAVGNVATNVYIAIAFVVLPVLVPISVLVITPDKNRRRVMLALLVAGLIAALDFTMNVSHGNTHVKACHNYLDIRVSSSLAITGLLYGLATCAVMLLSGYRHLRMWGWLNVVAVGILIVRFQEGLPSLWCLWAACTSFFVLWFVKELNAQHEVKGTWEWEVGSSK